jgi:hypothetical protein
VEVLQYLHDHGGAAFSDDVAGLAATYGHLDALDFALSRGQCIERSSVNFRTSEPTATAQTHECTVDYPAHELCPARACVQNPSHATMWGPSTAHSRVASCAAPAMAEALEADNLTGCVFFLCLELLEKQIGSSYSKAALAPCLAVCCVNYCLGVSGCYSPCLHDAGLRDSEEKLKMRALCMLRAVERGVPLTRAEWRNAAGRRLLLMLRARREAFLLCFACARHAAGSGRSHDCRARELIEAMQQVPLDVLERIVAAAGLRCP